MSLDEIQNIFVEAIQEKAVYNKLEGVTRNDIYNWLNGRTKPSYGDMMYVLYQLGTIEISIKCPLQEAKFKNKIKTTF